MQYYISRGEAQYMDANRGHFSKSMALWAIANMRRRNGAGDMERINPIPFDEAMNALESNGVHVDDACVYDAWYLYNMCLADYSQSLPTQKEITAYIDETINDPDCKPEAVLACFRAKMDVMGIPIHWERYL